MRGALGSNHIYFLGLNPAWRPWCSVRDLLNFMHLRQYILIPSALIVGAALIACDIPRFPELGRLLIERYMTVFGVFLLKTIRLLTKALVRPVRLITGRFIHATNDELSCATRCQSFLIIIKSAVSLRRFQFGGDVTSFL